MTLSLSKKGVKLQKHNQYRHAGPRSPEKGQAHLLPLSTAGDPASGAG